MIPSIISRMTIEEIANEDINFFMNLSSEQAYALKEVLSNGNNNSKTISSLQTQLF